MKLDADVATVLASGLGNAFRERRKIFTAARQHRDDRVRRLLCRRAE
jgi:hypothetical protein